MIVDVECWHWTPTGMRPGGTVGGYIEVREVERLLEEAHRRGYRAALQDTSDSEAT